MPLAPWKPDLARSSAAFAIPVTNLHSSRKRCSFASSRCRNPRSTSMPRACVRSSAPRVEYFGHTVTFDSFGGIVSEIPSVVSQSPEEFALLAQTSESRPAEENGLVGFHSEAFSRGPPSLPSDGTFSLEAVMPYGSARLSVCVSYASGTRGEVALRFEAIPDVGSRGADKFAQTPPLDAADIAGFWAGDSLRWNRIGEPSSQVIEREYASTNSMSSMLLRLPLGVSVVAVPEWRPGARLSFGCGWSPVVDRRPVMIRSYDEAGNLEKVDWRVERKMR